MSKDRVVEKTVDDFVFLKGVGKASRHVEIKKLAEVNRDALRDYIKQALKFDEK